MAKVKFITPTIKQIKNKIDNFNVKHKVRLKKDHDIAAVQKTLLMVFHQ